MALEQLEMDTGLNKVEFAIQLLQTWEPQEGYYFADSGGKDSCATRDILIKSGVKFDAHYNVSPVDPQPIRDFLKECHPETVWDYHARNFVKTIVKKGLPMIQTRWCCEIIKEVGGNGRVVVVGNRRAESSRRSKQCYVEQKKYGKVHKTIIRPIANFDNYDIWQYIRENNVKYCYLYDEGSTRKGYGEGIFKRLGCVLCPFSNNIERELKYFPREANIWLIASNQIVKNQIANGYKTSRGKELKYKFVTGQEKFDWWIKRGRRNEG